MTSVRGAFERLRGSRRKALIPFVMAGDPSLSVTGELLIALQDAGADLIEVGIPFSDPLADGPVIQASSARALAQGTTPARALEVIASVRHRLAVPIVCLSYWNPLIQFGANGLERSFDLFARAAQQSGVAGLIVPDLPIEEGDGLRITARRRRLATVFLAAPTSPPERLRLIARASEGFIYYVSVTGTTGVRRELPSGLVQGLRQLKLLTTKPICVGFGISTPDQATQVARIADGVIIGSALIRQMQSATNRKDVVRRAVAFVKRLRRAVR